MTNNGTKQKVCFAIVFLQFCVVVVIFCLLSLSCSLLADISQKDIYPYRGCETNKARGRKREQFIAFVKSVQYKVQTRGWEKTCDPFSRLLAKLIRLFVCLFFITFFFW